MLSSRLSLVCLWSGSSRHLPLQAAACRLAHGDKSGACAYSCIHKVRLAHKCAHTYTRAHVRANGGHLRTHSTHTHRHPERCPTSSLASCCPCAPTSRLPTGGLILPPAAEGVMPSDANRHQAQSGHTGATVLFSSPSLLYSSRFTVLLFTLPFFLFRFYSNWNLNLKCHSMCVCVCVCVCAYTEQCERMDPGHSRVVTHLNEQYWPAYWLHACVREKGGGGACRSDALWALPFLSSSHFLHLFLMIVSPRLFVYCVIALTCVYLKTTISCWIIASVVIQTWCCSAAAASVCCTTRPAVPVECDTTALSRCPGVTLVKKSWKGKACVEVDTCFCVNMG